jgi:hypothetical protein
MDLVGDDSYSLNAFYESYATACAELDVAPLCELEFLRLIEALIDRIDASIH